MLERGTHVFKVHVKAELSGVTCQELEELLVSARASSWDIVMSSRTIPCFGTPFRGYLDGVFFVSRRQGPHSLSSGAGQFLDVGDSSQGLRT